MTVFLETPRLVLRTVTEHDLDDVVALDNDPEVMRYVNGGRPASREEVRAGSLRRLMGRGFWAAEARVTGEWLGWFSLEPLEGEGEGVVELGYRLRRAAWGRGYATEGSRALIDKGFRELGVRRVTANTMTVNAGSRRVMEKCGLTYVRTFFEEWPDVIEGSDQGDVEYAATREEWLLGHG
ncbi:GNAT family N-acetyltransferase [Streptomyces sp. CB03238]|uniref:GNAT family N-acetyltransferase n=1 Tax=Streptomyces sp. CB03238 TaxID=1907777 RepID=UPI000A0FD358|nr:GNAT family N-acetyltransferase [Streptomyces sp. CB03238]ORT54899.1 GNAT family N-acetyltransferase [Streptomyces sp. CB03238]